MSDPTTFPRDDARRVARLDAAKERRHAFMALRHAETNGSAHTFARRGHPKDPKSWRPLWGSLAFEVLGYASYDMLTTNGIAWNLGRDPKDIRPIVSQLRRARLLTDAEYRGIVEATVLGGGYYAREEARHGVAVLPDTQALINSRQRVH